MMFPQGKKSLFYDVSSKQQLMKLKESGLSKACVLLSLYTIKTHKNWFHSHNNSDNNAAFSQIIQTLVTDLRKCIETRNHEHWILVTGMQILLLFNITFVCSAALNKLTSAIWHFGLPALFCV